jgi:hypothetical protein
MSEIFAKIEQIYGGTVLGAMVPKFRRYYHLSESVKSVQSSLNKKYENNDSAEIPSLTIMLHQYQDELTAFKLQFTEMIMSHKNFNWEKVGVLSQMVHDEDVRITSERTKKITLAKLESFANDANDIS